MIIIMNKIVINLNNHNMIIIHKITILSIMNNNQIINRVKIKNFKILSIY